MQNSETQFKLMKLSNTQSPNADANKVREDPRPDQDHGGINNKVLIEETERTSRSRDRNESVEVIKKNVRLGRTKRSARSV